MPRLKIIGLLVLEKIFKVFTIYWNGGHLGHVTWTIYINFHTPFPRRLDIKFGFDWPFLVLEENIFEMVEDNEDGRWSIGIL